MYKKLLLLLWVVVLSACESNDPVSNFGNQPTLQNYYDDAQVARKLYCPDAKCSSPSSEEKYVYSSANKLTRIEQLYRMESGKMDMSSYVDYKYNQAGLLSSKTRYGKHGFIAGWVAYESSEYEYENGVLKEEKNYFTQQQPVQKVLTGSVLYEIRNGIKTGQKYFDGQNKLYQRVSYAYTNNVLTRETWHDGDDNVIRIFEHQFAGNRRQIGEYLLNSREQLALIEKIYDDKGRLISQETKVNNPLLCVMMPGILKFEY